MSGTLCGASHPAIGGGGCVRRPHPAEVDHANSLGFWWPVETPEGAALAARVWHTALVLDEPRQEIGTHDPLIGQDDAAAALLLAVDDRAEVLVRWDTLEKALAFGENLVSQIRLAQQLEAEAARRVRA